MEGRQSTFKKVLADFEARLQTAEYVAIDTELTGVDLEGEPDSFDECASERLEKLGRVAERFTLIQVGLTLVTRLSGDSTTGDGQLACASYNLFAFPYIGPETSVDSGFFCQASALKFNAMHRVNFNTWIREGIPYMSREEEKRFIASRKGENHIEEKVGLLRLWKTLCAARLPFVVHSPLDLFFLLVAFERRPLPVHNPRALAVLIRHCTPKVYDTAYLHGALGRFKRLSLMKYFEDAQAQYEELQSNSHVHTVHVPRVEFKLEGETLGRYGRPAEDLSHEAGFDSFITAKLFAYLRAIAPSQVKEGANKLFLFKSVEFLDLDRLAVNGEVGTSMFDLTRVTLLVAALEGDPATTAGNCDVPRQIAAFGYTYKKMDAKHVLVVLRASGGAAVRKAAELAGKVHGVSQWLPFEEWRQREVVQKVRFAASRGIANGKSAQARLPRAAARTGPAADPKLVGDFLAAAESGASPSLPGQSPQADPTSAVAANAAGNGVAASPSGCQAVGTAGAGPLRAAAILRHSVQNLLLDYFPGGSSFRTSWVFSLLAVGAAGLLVLTSLSHGRASLSQRVEKASLP
eukprot:TRINITY_DN7326_c0_g1_i1.p1 TRINITY_DN7326_c0_g1~~TRINITY_DN7326_c0_g1_i1.p1  ORF type:complete len:576 (+),score=78.72 TRINITY_DN7326_c0_g1_i1:191-1918(+)